MSDRWARVNKGLRLLFDEIDAPGIKPIKHEQEDHYDKPQIGQARSLAAFDYDSVQVL